MKPRLVLDIAFLGHAHDAKSARRGAQRVASHLFDGLQAAGELDLSYVATAHLAGAHDFLAARNIEPKEKLFFRAGELRASRISRHCAARYRAALGLPGIAARLQRRLFAVSANFFARAEGVSEASCFAKADLFHSPHTPFPDVVHEQKKLKKFITLHDFIPLKNPEYYQVDLRPLMDGVLRCLTPENFALAVSNATRDDALNLSKIRPENIFVTPLAADPKIFRPEPDHQRIAAVGKQFGIPAGPYFLALSAHDRHKNFPHLIRCFGELVESGELTDTNLVIVGSNPGLNPEVTEALARYPRAKPRVIVAGFVPDEDLAAIYSGATAFLFPSLAEGFGIPPLEAMQCGAPVIASNTTSMPEVIGDAGILLSPTDKDAWCQNMLLVSRDEALRAELRKKSFERCRLFSWERFMAETLRGYRMALTGKF